MNIKIEWQPSKRQLMTWLVLASGAVSLLVALVTALGVFLHWNSEETAAIVVFVTAIGAFIKFVLQVLQNGAVAEANQIMNEALNTPSPEQQRANADTQPGYVAAPTLPEG